MTLEEAEELERDREATAEIRRLQCELQQRLDEKREAGLKLIVIKNNSFGSACASLVLIMWFRIHPLILI